MAAGPWGPTVYSVARTLMMGSSTVDPSGRTPVATVPGLNSNVAWRVPSSSVTTVPRATCGVVAARSTGVTTASSSTSAISATVSNSRHATCTVRSEGRWPVRVALSLSVPPPFTAMSNRPSSRVKVYPKAGAPMTSTRAPVSAVPFVDRTRPRTTAMRSGRMVPAATPR